NNGHLYFTEWFSSKIGEMEVLGSGPNAPGHLYGEYATPTGNSNPTGIVLGPDCNPWFTETNAGYVGTVDTAAGHITEFKLPTDDSQPVGITVGPDGNLWIAESAANQLATFAPTGGWSNTRCAGLELPAIAKCQDSDLTLATDAGKCTV